MTEEKQKILENLKNTYCRVKTSKIEGIGIFAIRDIPKGKNPFFGVKVHKWHEFTVKELKKIDKEVFKMIDSFFVIEKNDTVYIPETGLNGNDISFYLNTSSKPNIETIDGGTNFASTRKIKRGEELTVAYSTYDDKYKK